MPRPTNDDTIPPATEEEIARLEEWNHRRLDAARVTGSTFERQENVCGPDALRRALRLTD